jgi:two-component system, sensor histidine kinase and response regulator
VLIIDDNRHIRTQINLVLKLEGFETIEAEHGAQGIELAQERRPDLIVCDIIMPELDGYGVLERLRGLTETADIPFLFLSAKADRSDVREGMNLGADDYLVKPFSAQELVQAITARINRHNVTKREWERRVESLSAMSYSRDRFMSMMSHDLKSAFAGVMGLSEMLASKLDDLSFDRLQEISSLMKDAVQSTYNLLQSFVEWSRLQASGMQPAIGSLNIGEMTLSVMMQNSGYAAHKNIALTCTIPPDTHVMADANMTQVIIRNLLSNAIKFTQLGGAVEISVRETLLPNDSSIIEYSVNDNGVGMTEEEVAKLMNADAANGIQLSMPGTQGEKGTGLGMMFCRELLEKQGGTLTIHSKPSHGTTVTFTLAKA